MFRSIVHNLPNLNTKVHFSIDGVSIPVTFQLVPYHLNLPNQTPGGPNGIQLAFQTDTVDVRNFYYEAHRNECEFIEHETFFKIAEIVAALYETPLSVKSDHSFKVINGFGVPSSVLSMTKPNGRNFYGKYGFISPVNTPALTLAAIELSDDTNRMLNRIECFAGNSDERLALQRDLKEFTRMVESTISSKRDYSLGMHNYPLFKTSHLSIDSIQLKGSDTLDGVYTDIKDKYYLDQPFPAFLHVSKI